MPGTSWHIADVGFLSPERLIVAQRLFSDAPCFITKDGGETWEEIDLPDKMVTAIHSEIVAMFVGPNETDQETYVMTSEDFGDHWTDVPMGPSPFMQADLDHDGIPDPLTLRKMAREWGTTWILEFTASDMLSPTWKDEATCAGWRGRIICSSIRPIWAAAAVNTAANYSI